MATPGRSHIDLKKRMDLGPLCETLGPACRSVASLTDISTFVDLPSFLHPNLDSEKHIPAIKSKIENTNYCIETKVCLYSLFIIFERKRRLTFPPFNLFS